MRKAVTFGAEGVDPAIVEIGDGTSVGAMVGTSVSGGSRSGSSVSSGPQSSISFSACPSQHKVSSGHPRTVYIYQRAKDLSRGRNNCCSSCTMFCAQLFVDHSYT